MIWLSTKFQPDPMKTRRSCPETRKQSQVWKIFKKCNNYQNMVYSNLKEICDVPPQDLYVPQVSTWSHENCRRIYLES